MSDDEAMIERALADPKTRRLLRSVITDKVNLGSYPDTQGIAEEAYRRGYEAAIAALDRPAPVEGEVAEQEPAIVEKRARAICVALGTDADEILDPYGPVRRWDCVAYHVSEAIEEIVPSRLAHTAPKDAGVAEERERAARMLETAIGEGYNAPARKVDQCEHGKFGWEDCIACYDEALTAVAAAIRAGSSFAQSPPAHHPRPCRRSVHRS